MGLKETSRVYLVHASHLWKRCAQCATGISPLSEAILKALPFGSEQKDNLHSIPSRIASLFSINISVFRKAPNLGDCKHAFSVCPHQCSWQVRHAAASPAKVYCCVMWRETVQEGLGGCTWSPCESATRLCCSLLGNAGRALARGFSGGRAGFASVLRFGLCTQTFRAACTKADTLVQSPPSRRCQKRAHMEGCWCRSSLGASQQPISSPGIPALSTSCRSWLSPHCSVAPALLPAWNAVPPLDGGQSNYPTIQVRNQHVGQWHDPPSVTGQHMDVQRCLSKDPSLFLAECFVDHWSMSQSLFWLTRPQEGFNYICLQLCKTTGQRVPKPHRAGEHESTASSTGWAAAASWSTQQMNSPLQPTTSAWEKAWAPTAAPAWRRMNSPARYWPGASAALSNDL